MSTALALQPVEPCLRVSFAGGVDDATVDATVAILRREGVVVLDDIVDPALAEQCRAELVAAYPHYATPDGALNYGPYNGRHCMPMVVERMLADAAFFVPAVYDRIAARMLGAEYMVDSIGLLVALPGAPDQKQHADSHLFPEVDLERLLPAFALGCSMPLVPMDEVSGRTAFWRGSHRQRKAPGDWDYAPTVLPGSATIWDFRVKHCGLANRGDAPRPTIFTVLSRHWWVEMHPPEATRYLPLQIARPVLESLSPKTRERLHRARIVG